MTKEEFLSELQEIMMIDIGLAEDTELETIEEYDSMTQVTILGLFEDEFGIQLEPEDLEKVKTVRDILAMAGLD